MDYQCLIILYRDTTCRSYFIKKISIFVKLFHTIQRYQYVKIMVILTKQTPNLKLK